MPGLIAAESGVPRAGETARMPPRLMSLHRLHVASATPLFDEVDPLGSSNVPGVLRVQTADRIHVARCPDTITLVTALWNRRPYGAHGQILRPAEIGPRRVELEAVWVGGSALLLQTLPADWDACVADLARTIVRLLRDGEHQGLTAALAPVLTSSP